mgnify:CR=1 FL=1
MVYRAIFLRAVGGNGGDNAGGGAVCGASKEANLVGGERMARLQKSGLEYFPLNVDIDQDDKIALIEATHGIVGFGVVVRLFMKIYKEGYYYEWTEREQLLFSKRVNVDIKTTNVIINDCLRWGLFNKDLYDKHHILTSKGIQRRYFAALTRRKNIEVFDDFILIDLTEFRNVNIIGLNVDNSTHSVGQNVDNNINSTVQNVDSGTQSKVKESKVKESKYICHFTPPTLKEVQAYCKSRNNGVDAEKWLNFYTAKGWMIGKNKMKDWKAAVRTWEKKGTEKKPPQKKFRDEWGID